MLFIGILSGDIKLVEEACANGANVNITDSTIISYHEGYLSMRCPELLNKFIAIRKKVNTEERSK